MGQTRLDASLSAGPPNAGESVFPGTTANIPVNLTPNPKNWQHATGVLTRVVNVATPAWLTLDGVGATATISECGLLYFRSSAPLNLRITQTVAGVGSVVTEHRVYGLFIWEPPESEPLTLLEVQGNGTIEYFAQGQR
jgi:hypothetical protein